MRLPAGLRGDEQGAALREGMSRVGIGMLGGGSLAALGFLAGLLVPAVLLLRMVCGQYTAANGETDLLMKCFNMGFLLLLALYVGAICGLIGALAGFALGFLASAIGPSLTAGRRILIVGGVILIIGLVNGWQQSTYFLFPKLAPPSPAAPAADPSSNADGAQTDKTSLPPHKGP